MLITPLRNHLQMFSSLNLILVSMLLPFGVSNQPGCPSEQDDTWNITWPPTMGNQSTATQQCPGGNETEGNVTRRCFNNNSWAPLNLSQCRTTKFTVFQNQIYEILEYFNATDDCNCTVESSINTDKLFDTLEIVTSGIIDTINTTIPILPNDIPVIVDILEAILSITQDCKQFFVFEQRTRELREDIVTILNIMLYERHDDSFEATLATMRRPARRASERLLRIIEKVGILFAFTFNTTHNDRQNETFNGSHIGFYVLLPSRDDVMRNGSVNFQRNMTNRTLPQIGIPRLAIRRRFMRKGRRIFIVNSFILNLETRLQNDDGQSTASEIISTQLVDIEGCLRDTSVDLDDDENVELRINLRMSSLINPRCAFWDFTRNGNTGGFSKEGITQRSIDDNNILTCSSNHLTSFAVLVDTTGDNNNTPALSIVTYVGCTISMICLTFSVFLLLIFRKKIFNQVRHFIHVNLSVALLLGLLVFVSGIEAANNFRAGCLTVAILLHYFFLAAFSWMLCEAIVLLVAVKFVFYEGFFKTAKFFVSLGWGLPVPVVAISVVILHEQYGTNGRCWISEEKGAIWAFIGPMLLIVLINSMVYIITVHQVFKTKHNAVCTEKASAVESTKVSLRSAIILLPLLGVTWVFGLLAVNEDTIAFAWVFTILNSLQGLFIFFFHVVRNKQFFAMIKQHITKNASSGTHSHTLNSHKSHHT